MLKSMQKELQERDKAMVALDQLMATTELQIEMLKLRYPALKHHGHLAVISRHIFRYLEGREFNSD